MGCLIAVKCTVECRLKRSAICYAIGEGGVGCVALLQKPEMSYFKMLGGLFSVNGFLNVILFPLLILVIRHKDRKYGMKLWFMILANI